MVTTDYTFTPTAGQCATPTSTTITIGCGAIVNLKFFIQDYYDIGTRAMRPVRLNQGIGVSATDVEDVTVTLYNALDLSMVATTTAMLQTNGSAVCNFTSLPNGSYYIAVYGRNFIETWSNTPQIIGNTALTYDFSNASSKAYGNNMNQIDTDVWAFYSGDINQDDSIDNSDSSEIFLDIENSSFGVLASDLNGDGAVDNADTDSFYTNIENSFYSKQPL